MSGSRIPTLSTFAEIGRFCNPTTATSTAIICKSSLRDVILELLENAKGKALQEGKILDRKEEVENRKNVEKRAYKNGWREGHKVGLKEGKEEWDLKYGLAYAEGKAHS